MAKKPTRIIDIQLAQDVIYDGNVYYGVLFERYNTETDGNYYLDNPLNEKKVSSTEFLYYSLDSSPWFYYTELKSGGLVFNGNDLITDKKNILALNYSPTRISAGDVTWTEFKYGYYDLEIFVDAYDKDGNYIRKAYDCGLKVIIYFDRNSVFTAEDFDLCKKDDKGKLQVKYFGYIPQIFVLVVDAQKYYQYGEPNIVVHVKRHIQLNTSGNPNYFLYIEKVIEDAYLVAKPYVEYKPTKPPEISSFIVQNDFSGSVSRHFNAFLSASAVIDGGYTNGSVFKGFYGKEWNAYDIAMPLTKINKGFINPFPTSLDLMNVVWKNELDPSEFDVYITKYDIDYNTLERHYLNVINYFDTSDISIDLYSEPIYEKFTEEDREKLKNFLKYGIYSTSYHIYPEFMTGRIKDCIDEYNYLRSEYPDIAYGEYPDNYEPVLRQKYSLPLLRRFPNFRFITLSYINFRVNSVVGNTVVPTRRIPFVKKINSFKVYTKVSSPFVPSIDYIDVYLYDIINNRLIKLDGNYQLILTEQDIKQSPPREFPLKAELEINRTLTNTYSDRRVEYNIGTLEFDISNLYNVSEWAEKVGTPPHDFGLFLVGLKIKDNIPDNLHIVEYLLYTIKSLNIYFKFELDYDTYDLLVDVDDINNTYNYVNSYETYLDLSFTPYKNELLSGYYSSFMYKAKNFTMEKEHVYLLYSEYHNGFIFTFTPLSAGGGGGF